MSNLKRQQKYTNWFCNEITKLPVLLFQPKIDQLQEDVKLVRPAVEQTRQGQTKNPDVDRLEEDCNR